MGGRGRLGVRSRPCRSSRTQSAGRQFIGCHSVTGTASPPIFPWPAARRRDLGRRNLCAKTGSQPIRPTVPPSASCRSAKFPPRRPKVTIGEPSTACQPGAHAPPPPPHLYDSVAGRNRGKESPIRSPVLLDAFRAPKKVGPKRLANHGSWFPARRRPVQRQLHDACGP